MLPTQDLPSNYYPSARFTLQDTKALVMMNSLGLVILLFSAAIFFQVLFWLRPQEAYQAFTLELNLNQALFVLAGLLVLTVIMVLLHEAAHGVFFWLFTRCMPKFAFRGFYAYAAAPNWYLPRNAYLVTAIAPLILISLLGIFLLAIVPPGWFMPIMLVLVMNASGAVGDLWVMGMLLKSPPDALANDQGDKITIYSPRKLG